MKLEFNLSGRTNEVLEDAITEFAEAQFGEADVERVLDQQTAAARDGGTLAVVALLLAIPGSVLATLQIAEKLDLKRRLEQLLKRVRESDGDERTSILLTVNDRTTLDLKTASADRIIVILEREAAKDER